MNTKSLKKQDKQTEVLRYRCTENESKAIKSRAEKAGLSLSEYQRRMCLKGKITIKESKADVAMIGELLAIGKNLNQLVKSTHIHGLGAEDRAHFGRHLKQLEQVVEGLIS